MNFIILTKTKVEKFTAIQLIHKFTGAELDVYTNEEVGDMWMSFPYLKIDEHEKVVNAYSDDQGLEVLVWETQLNEIVERLTVLNDNTIEDFAGNKVEITKSGILIGNEKVSFEKFEELAKKVEKFLSSTKA